MEKYYVFVSGEIQNFCKGFYWNFLHVLFVMTTNICHDNQNENVKYTKNFNFKTLKFKHI